MSAGQAGKDALGRRGRTLRSSPVRVVVGVGDPRLAAVEVLNGHLLEDGSASTCRVPRKEGTTHRVLRTELLELGLDVLEDERLDGIG